MDLTSAPRGRAGRARAVVLRTAIGLAAGALLLLIFLRLVNVDAVYRRLEHLSISDALLCGAAFLCAYVVRALRWRRLLRPDRVSVRRVVAIYQIAVFLNWLLPVQGGELAKSILLRRSDGIPVSRSLATVGMDKTMDLVPAIGLLIVLPFTGLDLTGPLWSLLGFALAIIGFVATVLALALWRREQAISLLNRPVRLFVRGRARQRLEPFTEQFLDTLLALIRQPRLLAVSVAYTAVAVALDALFCLLAFRAVGVSVPVVVAVYGYTFFNLAFILPTPPAHLGSNELIGLLIFSGLFGINRSAVAAMFLFSHPWTGILMTCTGLGFLSGMGLTLRSALRLTQAEEEGKPMPELVPETAGAEE